MYMYVVGCVLRVWRREIIREYGDNPPGIAMHKVYFYVALS